MKVSRTNPNSCGVIHKRGLAMLVIALLVLVIALPRWAGGQAAAVIYYVGRANEGVAMDDAALRDISGLPPGTRFVFLATSNPGLHIVDLTTGEIVRSKDLPGLPMFGVVPHLKEDRGCLFGYGSGSARTCFFPEIDDFGFTEIGFGLFTDAGLLSPTPVEETMGMRHLLWSVGNSVFQEHQPGGPGTPVGRSAPAFPVLVQRRHGHRQSHERRLQR